MVNQLRAEALALIAVTPECTLSTIGPAGVQASVVTCLVDADCLYLLVGLNGRQLAEQVLAQCPAMKVLYMSGYTDTVMPPTLFDPSQAFVPKPFTPIALARKVGELLRASAIDRIS